MLDLMYGQIPRRATRLMLAVGVLGALAACSNVQSFDYTAIDEIPPGPGLISGADGGFVLYKRDAVDDGE